MVSVCMITYGHELYIKEAIESVLMQHTDFDYELIITDDCSPDATENVVRSLIESHKNGHRIRYTKHKENLGMMPNFVYTLKQCNGKYIALCEGDDYWTDPLKLQKQVDFLETNPDYIMCFHLCEFLRSGENSVNEVSKQSLGSVNYEFTIGNLLKYWNIPTAAVVYRNILPIHYPDWFTNVASGDIALLMLLYEQGKFKLFEEYMSVYRITGEGASKTHVNYKMIYYRAKLYTYLNEYFNYKYEKEIYDALNHIYKKFSEKKINNNFVKQSRWSGLKQKGKIILKDLIRLKK